MISQAEACGYQIIPSPLVREGEAAYDFTLPLIPSHQGRGNKLFRLDGSGKVTNFLFLIQNSPFDTAFLFSFFLFPFSFSFIRYSSSVICHFSPLRFILTIPYPIIYSIFNKSPNPAFRRGRRIQLIGANPAIGEVGPSLDPSPAANSAGVKRGEKIKKQLRPLGFLWSFFCSYPIY
jgi:hypothetical protein